MLETLVMQYVTSLKSSTLYFKRNKNIEFDTCDDWETAEFQTRVEEKR